MKTPVLAALVVVACLARVVPALAGAPGAPPQSDFPSQASAISAVPSYFPTQAGTTSAVPLYRPPEAGSTSAAPLTASAVPVQAGPGSSSPYLSKVDHLRMAAAHLDVAGLNEDAQRLRQLAAKEESREPSAFIKVDLCVVEVSLNKLANVDCERYGGRKGTSVLDLLTKLARDGTSPKSCGVASSSEPKLPTLIEGLQRDGFAEVRFRPSLWVVPGMPATVDTRRNLGAATDSQGRPLKIGGRADVLADLAANDQIHMSFRLCVSRPDYSGPIAGIPPVTNTTVATSLDLRSGQTIVLGGLATKRNSNDRDRTLTFVTVRAEIVKKVGAASAATRR